MSDGVKKGFNKDHPIFCFHFHLPETFAGLQFYCELKGLLRKR